MAATVMKYFDDWRTRILTCPSCGWQGTFEQGSRDFFEMVMDSSCPYPNCPDNPMLAVVGYPTVEACIKNFERMEEPEKDFFLRSEAALAQFTRLKLRSADQLPNVDAPVLDLQWDMEGENLAIRLGERLLWTEPPRYECEWRYREILDILKEKYGPRLRDLEPTRASWYNLYGDDLSSAEAIDRLRRDLRGTWEAARSLD